MMSRAQIKTIRTTIKKLVDERIDSGGQMTVEELAEVWPLCGLSGCDTPMCLELVSPYCFKHTVHFWGGTKPFFEDLCVLIPIKAQQYSIILCCPN